MKKITALVAAGAASVLACLSFGQSSPNNPGWPQTNVVYAALAGYAHTGGTSVVATATAAALVVETNRAQVAENTINTNRIALRASDTNRIAVLEAKVAVVITNTYISAIFTNASGGVTNYTTTNVVRYVVP